MSKTSYFDANARNTQLREKADTSHDSADDMYSSYGAHISTEHHGDLVVQTVEADWVNPLADNLTDDEIAAKIREDYGEITDDEIEQLIDLARRVWRDMDGIDSLLEDAVAAYDAGDLDACIEALQAAGHAETEHGDDPSTSDLAERLLEPRVAYRVYCAPDGCDQSFCGEYRTLEEAQEAAENEPAGLPRSEWGTARAAGHCGGQTAPENDGDEDDEPESWHGVQGWHYVVRVTYS